MAVASMAAASMAAASTRLRLAAITFLTALLWRTIIDRPKYGR